MRPTETIDDNPWPLGPAPADDPEPPPSTEVLVVGGGVAGASIALGLARRGARVVMVDPGEPSLGASGRDAGLVYAGLSEHPARVARSLGPERSRTLYRLARRSGELLGELAAPVEQLWLAVDEREEQEVDQSVGALQRLGFEVRSVEPTGIAERGLRGRRGFVVGGDGLVSPQEALARLLALGRAAGVCLHRGRVERIDEDLQGLIAILGPRRVRAEVVIYAAGIGGLGIEPYFEGKLWAVREQALRIRCPLPPVAGRAGYGWTWFRPMPGGTLVGGCRWATPHLEVGEIDPVPTEAVQGKIEAFARRHLSAPEAPIDARWAWIEAHSCDGLPLVGPLPGQVRRIACTGFCGNDWGLGPVCAELVVDGLTVGSTDPPAMFAASRFLA